MKLNLAHVVTYLVTGLVWLASLDQTLVTSLVGPTLAKYATGVIVLAGALVVFLQHIGVISPPTATAAPVTKQAGFSRTGLLICLAFAGLTLALGVTACSTISAWLSSPTASTVITASVDVAVAAAEAKGVTAVQINSIAKQALAADTGASGTLSAISGLVNAQVAKLNLPALDLVAAQILETALTAAIEAKLEGNTDLAMAQAAVADVLNAAIAATGG